MQEVVIISSGDKLSTSRDCNFVISSGLASNLGIYFPEFDGGIANIKSFEDVDFLSSNRRIVILLMGENGEFTPKQITSLIRLLGVISDKYGKIKVLREEDFKEVEEKFTTISNRTLYEVKTFMTAKWV